MLISKESVLILMPFLVRIFKNGILKQQNYNKLPVISTIDYKYLL